MSAPSTPTSEKVSSLDFANLEESLDFEEKKDKDKDKDKDKEDKKKDKKDKKVPPIKTKGKGTSSAKDLFKKTRDSIVETPVDFDDFSQALLAFLAEKKGNPDDLLSKFRGLDMQTCSKICLSLMNESDEVKSEITAQLLDENSRMKYLFAFIFGRTIQWQDQKEAHTFVISYAPILLWTYLFETVRHAERSEESDDLAILEMALLELNTLHLRRIEFRPLDALATLTAPSVYHPGYKGHPSVTRELPKESLDFFNEVNISNRTQVFQGILSLFRDQASKIEHLYLKTYCFAIERLLVVGTPFSMESKSVREKDRVHLRVDPLLTLDNFAVVSLNHQILFSILQTLGFCLAVGSEVAEIASVVVKQLHRRACFDTMTGVIVAAEVLLNRP